MTEKEKAIEHFEHGINYDIFSEPVTTYAKLAVKYLKQPEIIYCKDCSKLGFCGENTNLEVMGFYGYCSRAEKKL